MHSNVAEEPQGPGLVSVFLTGPGALEGLHSVGVRVSRGPASRYASLIKAMRYARAPPRMIRG
jgi:hypothetical protein